ncbi:hypothetical protein WN944_016780 [Citrus x changshan-huyou]|uniref:Uncharacterized protein n=1 Tax=Citrus x changshan-huyou TaxID=2935761 RepID=A0AAP0QNX9_9ROSI
MVSLLSQNARLYPSPPPILQWNFPFLANTYNTKRSKFAVNIALLSRLKTKLHRQLFHSKCLNPQPPLAPLDDNCSSQQLEKQNTRNDRSRQSNLSTAA